MKPRLPKTKVCTKCGKRKPLGEYHAYKRMKDGKRPDCKECNIAASVAWRMANREKAREANRAWYAKNREKARARHARYRASPWGRAKEAEYYQQNRERIIAMSAAWNTRNSEWCNVQQQLRRIGGF